MIDKDILEKLRTPKELDAFINNELNFTKSNSSLKKDFRLKKGKNKEFIEELIPFNIFFSKKFNEDYLGKIIIGNQGYDAIIYNKNVKNEKYYIEVTFPIDGKQVYYDSKKLNEDGFVISLSDDDFKSKRDIVIDNVIKTAKEKALKDYNYEKSILIIVLSFWRFTSLNKDKDNQLIIDLISKLKEIEYKVKSVYLIKYSENEIYEIKNNCIEN